MRVCQVRGEFAEGPSAVDEGKDFGPGLIKGKYFIGRKAENKGQKPPRQRIRPWNRDSRQALVGFFNLHVAAKGRAWFA